jgi:hypothetical protein
MGDENITRDTLIAYIKRDHPFDVMESRKDLHKKYLIFSVEYTVFGFSYIHYSDVIVRIMCRRSPEMGVLCIVYGVEDMLHYINDYPDDLCRQIVFHQWISLGKIHRVKLWTHKDAPLTLNWAWLSMSYKQYAFCL